LSSMSANTVDTGTTPGISKPAVKEDAYLETISPEQLCPELVRKLPLEFLKEQCAIPITLGDKEVLIALADPLNIEAYDAIVNIVGRPCMRVGCASYEIQQAISYCYYDNTGVDGDMSSAWQSENTAALDGSSADAQDARADDDAKNLFVQTQAEDLLSIANTEPIIKLVNKIFFQAVNRRASDIHIEPDDNLVRIRFRIDGVLHEMFSLPRGVFAALVSRLKIMAHLNIAERRLPQDGQSRIKASRRLVDVRVSVIPTSGGERVVLRLLDKGSRQLDLETLGFTPDVLGRYRKLIGAAHGIILLTGPTGSGKTTSLYATIKQLNCEERNILTVEDPIEYQLPGVGQIQVKPKINLTFANCLRHILRQDPDVIMIGEIRDFETAEIAIQASLTGHLVLSTLHTNDSASAITRLLDMGIEPYLISSSVIAVMAQRLLRVTCPKCKKPYIPDEDMIMSCSQLENFSEIESRFQKGFGCEACLKTGYSGRTGIFELLTIDDDVKELIKKRSDSHVIKETVVKKGMTTLRENGLLKALAGETTLEEVCRVTQDSV